MKWMTDVPKCMLPLYFTRRDLDEQELVAWIVLESMKVVKEWVEAAPSELPTDILCRFFGI